MWKCNSCNTDNSNNANFCSNCGAPRSAGTQGPSKKGLPSRTAILLSAAVVCVVAGIWLINAISSGKNGQGANETHYSNPTSTQEVLSTQAPTPYPTPIPTPFSTPEPTPLSTPEPTPVDTPEPVLATPSIEDVQKFGDEITYPKSSSYLSDYETMYVKSGKGHSIYVYWKAQKGDEYRRKYYLYEQDEVTVIARENGFSCVIFTTENGEEHIGWVGSSLLVYEY